MIPVPCIHRAPGPDAAAASPVGIAFCVIDT